MKEAQEFVRKSLAEAKEEVKNEEIDFGDQSDSDEDERLFYAQMNQKIVEKAEQDV